MDALSDQHAVAPPEPEEHYIQKIAAAMPRLRRIAVGIMASTEGADEQVQKTCQTALADGSPHRQANDLAASLTQELVTDCITAADRTTETATTPFADFGKIPDAMRDAVRLTCELIGDLQPPARAAATLVCVDGRTHQDAAQLLNTDVAALGETLASARQQIAAGLGLLEAEAGQTSETELVRFVDNELAVDQARKTSAQLKADPALASRAAGHRQAVTLLRAAVNSPMHQAIPTDLQTMLDARRALIVERADAAARHQERRGVIKRCMVVGAIVAAIGVAGLLVVLLTL